MQIVIILLFAAGILLVYSAVKDERPQDVLRKAFRNG